MPQLLFGTKKFSLMNKALLLPSVKDKVFNLFVSGNVIYAIPSKGGC
jgi:hypothetical protein